jgi:tetratricopeptide (TPR) repeat protein
MAISGASFGEALELYRRGRYQEALDAFEAEIFKYRESPSYFYYAGLAALRLGDLEAATTYLKRCEQLTTTDDLDLLNALALLTLKSGKVSEAIEAYLRVLDLDHGNKAAKRGMAFIRKGIAQKRDLFWADPKSLEGFFPPMASAPRSRPTARPSRPAEAKGLPKALPVAALLLALGGLGLLAYFTLPSLMDLGQAKRLSTAANRTLTQVTQSASKDLRDAKRLLIKGRDNEAIILCNRVYNASDATAYDKELAVQMKGIAQAPDITKGFYNPSLSEIMRDPRLYEGCYVKFRGRATNIEQSPNRVNFDFLIGYQDGKKLDGIMSVYSDSGLAPEEENSYDVLGQVKLVNDTPLLRCVALHDLSYAEASR